MNKLLILTICISVSACGSAGRSNQPPVDTPPKSVNVNTANPTQTTADNSAVSPGDALTLVWSDEFDAPQLDPDVWYFESGDGTQYDNPGWGNNELQWYSPDNAEIRDGMLVINVREESQSGKHYTSARITTVDRFAFRYGRIEARMRLPGGQGIWPAFWLLPQDFAYGAWAASGEIDVMEAINIGAAGGNTVLGTLHYGGIFPDNIYTGNEHSVATDVASNFHSYALEWDESEMRWYVDDVLYAAQNSWSSVTADFPAPFDQPFYILLNVAVGGNLPGAPDAATVFPATMEVDYVRIYSGEP
jgi:beta-glucanase (GH16 family)